MHESLTIAVTGGRGFVGTAVCHEAERRGHRVIVLDAAGGARKGHDPIDVRDAEALTGALSSGGIDVVVHSAAIAGVSAVDRDLPLATSINVLGAVTVFECAAAAGIHRVVDVSSEEVYGARRANSGTAPIDEDEPLVPVSAYGVHKLAAELLGRGFAARGLEYVAARLAWVYGNGFPRTRPPQGWIEDAAAGQVSTAASGADHVADFVHVDDAAHAIVDLAQAPRLEHFDYNVGSGVGTRLEDAARILGTLVPGWRVDLAPGMLPAIASRGALSVERIRAELGWQADLSLEEGLRRTLRGVQAGPRATDLNPSRHDRVQRREHHD